MTIKKGFVNVHNILVENQDKKVSEILPLLMVHFESKSKDSTHKIDEHGLWIFCYYHKEWELVKQVEYGSKSNTKTGYNTMCKVGVNCWTKQQRDCKTNKEKLLNKLNNGEMKVEDITDELEVLEEERTKIIPLIDFHHEEALKEHEERFPTEEKKVAKN